MKARIDLPESIYHAARQMAHERGLSLSELVTGLLEKTHRRKEPKSESSSTHCDEAPDHQQWREELL